MNRRAVYLGVLYATLVIIFKLFIVTGEYALTRFGFFYSHITSVIFILPFYFVVIKLKRDRDNQGNIGGREALRVALTLFAVSVTIITAYNYIEFKMYGPQLAESYYRSEAFLDFLKHQKNLKEIDFPKIIENQIQQSSAFRATTGKLFSFLIIGVSGAFIFATLMKRNISKLN